MNQKPLYVLWGGLFILCAGLGFIPEPEGILRLLLTLLSLAFFVPGGLLLYRAAQAGDRQGAKLIRNLSALSLGFTVVLLVLSFLTAFASDWVGSFLHAMLVIVSAPMICSGYWALSLFLWACLLTGSLKILKA